MSKQANKQASAKADPWPFRCTVDVQPRKGETVKTQWAVTPDGIYPHIGTHAWENGEDVFMGRREPAQPMPERYRCNLLRADYAPATAEGNRRDFAGFGYGEPAAPGVLTLRGRDLGEVEIEAGRYVRDVAVSRITVRGHYTPTPAERAWIETEVWPVLAGYIEASRAKLRAAMLAGLRERCAAEVARVRDMADRCEAEALAEMSRLEKAEG
jgi:hypothetical protein